ncbi:site-specific integrase [Bacillus paranthracis]|uniref:site-specific integrase n=1 Tax=Bacillus paranthracis TaxID=2026186 RepID=UPI001583BB0B|nr:site-specific integrase [Bacillus paranthracis]NUJ06938.1 tyrosine-type recombinase/integrase [Bacillus paranthracis]
MGVIKEIPTYLGTTYDRFDNEGNLIQRAGTIGFSKEYKGRVYFVLTDLEGNKIKDANRYLNKYLLGESYKKRELAFTALKLLYSFFDLHRITSYREGLNNREIKQLVQFLEGGKYKGNNWTQEFTTKRRNNTINYYLGVYRDYYNRIFKVKDSEIHEKIIIGRYKGNGTMLGHTVKGKTEAYKNNKKMRKDFKAPKYIKLNQYEDIIEEINKNYTIRDKVIVELMYKYGLRLGEVLGLTLEDVIEGPLDTHYVFIRNRLQDKPWQHAKGLHIINDSLDYFKEVYSTEGIGYHLIIIDNEMLEMIEEYIDESRDELYLNQFEAKRKNLETKATADKLTVLNIEGIEGADVEENQYVFLSHQHYKPLTAAGWNYTLRKIFNTVGIKVDKEKKKNNLSHRFRHGFAMQKAHVLGQTQEQLASALRHSGTFTVMQYYNPDEEDLAALLQEQRGVMREEGYYFEKK